MNRAELIRQIKKYRPFNEQEERDKARMLTALSSVEDIFSRENELLHMTASAWVVNKDLTRVLMVYHNIYKSWSWLGGHADNDTDLLHVACKEVMEESGLKKVTPLSENIYSLEILAVNGHFKKGCYVGGHLHYNITYLLEADDEDPIFANEMENSAVGWFSPAEALKKSTEPWFVENIYTKLEQKLDIFLQSDEKSDLS